MYPKLKKLILKIGLMSLILTLLGLISCSRFEPSAYHPISEVPEGPGLFTGQSGAIVFGEMQKED